MVEVMAGVRVVEVADYVFVPAAGSILADWGADVIKVEHHERGDSMRGLRTGQPARAVSFNPQLEFANRGKRSIGLNLGHESGRRVLMELVTTADVFLTSKLEPTRRKLGFDVEDVRQHNPDIIYVRGSGRGVRGPDAMKGGFDALDFWYRTGAALGVKPQEVESVPFMPSGAFGDLTGAMNLAGGISAALFHRAQTGEALNVDVSLLSSGMWSLGAAVNNARLQHKAPEQRPAGETYNPLINTYRSRDGRWIAICCLQAERYWADFCRVIGRDDLRDDERFATDAGLASNCAEAVKILFEVFAQRTYDEWMGRLESFEGQWAPVQDALAVSTDPQTIANGYVTDSVTSTGEPFTTVVPPVQFDDAPATTRPAPLFNADGDELLTQLGYSMDQILELRIENAVT